MRRERKLNKIIQKQNAERREKLLNAMIAEDPSLAPKRDDTATRKKSVKRRLTIFLPIAAVATSLAIVLPCVLIDEHRVDQQYGGVWGDSDNYYFNGFNGTLKEYNDKYGTDYKYFDWYDHSIQDTGVGLYIEKAANNIAAVREEQFLEDKIEIVNLMIVSDDKLAENFLYEYIAISDNQYTGDGYTVHYGDYKVGTHYQSFGYAFYDGYRYCIRLRNKADSNRLIELFVELFEG